MTQKKMKTQTVAATIETQSEIATASEQIVPTAEQAGVPTPTKLKEAVTALATAPARGADGRWISKKSTEWEEIRKARVEKAITQIGDVLESSDLEIKDGDSASIKMLKTVCQNILCVDPNRGGLSGQSKALEMLFKMLGVGKVDAPKDEQNTFNVVLVDPLAGLTPSERAEALASAVEYKPKSSPTKPSWVTSEVVQQNPPRRLDAEYLPPEPPND